MDRLGRGRYEVVLVLDHQSFALAGGVLPNQKLASWTSTQLAIALNRFKFGD